MMTNLTKIEKDISLKIIDFSNLLLDNHVCFKICFLEL